MKMVCGCEVSKGKEFVSNADCPAHKGMQFIATKQVLCTGYVPWREPVRETDWPKCRCGEIAQMHDEKARC
jgi:hypothetical protein